ncbi:transporter substrate-binding domain-containing protein [Pseudonocardia sp. GCM10023141]|uniref:transporter substrate-binding domain-containing protein n=1 Tax=Pseudonocardia sp. GCM10023141 TaxID=3252653 RepID=UPI003609777A
MNPATFAATALDSTSVTERGDQQRPVPPGLVATFAPGGTLRASINLGNPILASRDGTTGEPVGVSIDLAREFARWLDVPVELVVFDKAIASVEAVRAEQADIGFFAVDPARSDGLLFIAPYVLIEGSYLVLASSAITAGEIVRFGGGAPVLAALRAGDVDVAAGICPVLVAEAERAPGLRVLPGRFMVIQQAMGLPAGRGSAARAFLAAFVEDVKATGFVADALRRHEINGGVVAPAASVTS